MARKTYCDFDDCSSISEDTNLTVRDNDGIRSLCAEHWRTLNRLFEKVSECYRKDFGCWRNHGADLYPNERSEYSIKYLDKYWELCDIHLQVYERFMSIWLTMPDLR
jgi:hypothetical protein